MNCKFCGAKVVFQLSKRHGSKRHYECASTLSEGDWWQSLRCKRQVLEQGVEEGNAIIKAQDGITPTPLEAYLEFANVLVVEEAGLGYDEAVAVAKAMHRRQMSI